MYNKARWANWCDRAAGAIQHCDIGAIDNQLHSNNGLQSHFEPVMAMLWWTAHYANLDFQSVVAIIIFLQSKSHYLQHLDARAPCRKHEINITIAKVLANRHEAYINYQDIACFLSPNIVSSCKKTQENMRSQYSFKIHFLVSGSQHSLYSFNPTF